MYFDIFPEVPEVADEKSKSFTRFNSLLYKLTLLLSKEGSASFEIHIIIVLLLFGDHSNDDITEFSLNVEILREILKLEPSCERIVNI